MRAPSRRLKWKGGAALDRPAASNSHIIDAQNVMRIALQVKASPNICGRSERISDMNITPLHGRRFRRSAINFAAINSAALTHAETILQRWLPDGRREGREWVALNPTRNHRHLGSFRINIASGKWSDFATGDAGGDLISLAAYLTGTRQGVAARNLADMLGVRHD